ncbi:TetR/AcrR family transcriptional regulator [Henriciella sp.]|uniref:TetR/AcrR family transcriptional regulator n=1 Tax=Henriciella sp. TaxID=1968823 RepID=UPI002624141B|nr:TetR/AcrR family transcriptional regulator [Henriciella sp.]
MNKTDSGQRARKTNAKPRIERAALSLFVDSGFETATTREIATRAGVSEGALYRHYKGKEQLALTLFMEIHNRMGEMVSQALAASGTAEERIRRAVTAYCALADEDWLLFSFHLVSLDRFLPHDERREDDPMTRIENVISAIMESGDIPAANPALVTSMCLGVVMQTAHAKIYNRIPGPFSDHVESFTQAIMAILYQK